MDKEEGVILFMPHFSTTGLSSEERYWYWYQVVVPYQVPVPPAAGMVPGYQVQKVALLLFVSCPITVQIRFYE